MLRITVLLSVFLSSVAGQSPTKLGVDDILVLQKAQDRAARSALFAKLVKTRVSVDFAAVSAKDLARYLTAASGNATNFVLMTRQALAPVTVQVANVPLTTVMDLAQRLGDVRFAFANGAVLLQHKDEVKEYTYLRTYDVRSATMAIPNRAGPELGFTNGEDDRGFAGEDDSSSSTISGFTVEKMVDLIRSTVLPASWDQEGISISEHRGVLAVRQTEKGHREVLRLLQQLGAIPVPRVFVRSVAPPPAPKKTERER